MPDSSAWFSDRARHAVMAAYQDAAGRGHDQVGTRHMLLALLYDEGCAAQRSLADLGVTYAAADDRVGFLSMEYCPSYPWFDHGTRGALDYALREADGLVGTGQILQGVLRDRSGSGPHLLKMMKVDPTPVLRQPLLTEAPASVPYPLPVFDDERGRRTVNEIERLLMARVEAATTE